jgi:hypothetical protein
MVRTQRNRSHCSLSPFCPRGKRYTEEQFTAMSGGMTVEKYRAKFMRKWGKK